MKFTLTYDGPLPSANGDKRFKKKWEIKKQIHPQLEELWKTRRSLQSLCRKVPKEAPYGWSEQHHMARRQYEFNPGPVQPNELDLCEPCVVGGVQFLPLVRNTYALNCALKILFMRKEPVGRVYQGGDLDNRIKTFIDSLKVPRDDAEHIAKLSEKPPGPVFCLLEDDGLVTGLNIESTQLLTEPSTPENYVRLVAEVDVQVAYPAFYNLAFLGD